MFKAIIKSNLYVLREAEKVLKTTAKKLDLSTINITETDAEL